MCFLVWLLETSCSFPNFMCKAAQIIQNVTLRWYDVEISGRRGVYTDTAVAHRVNW